MAWFRSRRSKRRTNRSRWLMSRIVGYGFVLVGIGGLFVTTSPTLLAQILPLAEHICVTVPPGGTPGHTRGPNCYGPAGCVARYTDCPWPAPNGNYAGNYVEFAYENCVWKEGVAYWCEVDWTNTKCLTYTAYEFAGCQSVACNVENWEDDCHTEW